MFMDKLKCSNCGCVIGFFNSSGAPHYHFYYCESCADKEEENENEQE